MANVSWCRCCGKEYQVCPTCAEVKVYKPWRIICDTAPHYQVWLIVSNYRKGIVDKAEAKKQLEGVKLDKQLNRAKEILAFELTKLVHSEAEAQKAQDAPTGSAVKRVTKNKGRK